MTVAGAPRARFRDALGHRDFRLLVGSYTVDQLGTWSAGVVLLVYVFDRTGSTTYLAVATAARWVPVLLVSSYAGVLADRYDRARLMRGCALVSFALATAMTLVVIADGPVPLLLVLSGGLGVAAAPYGPAAGALTADAVQERDLAAANALYGLIESLVVVAGPLLGAAFLATGRPELGLGLNAASFLVAAAFASGVRTRSRGDAGEHGEGLLAQVAGGAKALTSDVVARTLVVFLFLDTALYGATSVLYIPVSVHVGTGANGYGYLLAGQALGGVGAAVVANRLAGRKRLAPVILAGMLSMSLPFAVLAAVGAAPIAFALQVVAGAGMVVIDIIALTALQRELPRERLSRVLGLVESLLYAASLAGSVASAALLRVMDLGPALLVIGVGFSVVALLCLRPIVTADRLAAKDFQQVDERVQVLERLDLLAAAARPELELMARGIREDRLATGEVLIREGDPADALWVLVSGRLDVTIEGRLVNQVGPGEYVGEIGLLGARPRTATVVAGTECVVWRVDGTDFTAALEPVGPSESMRRVAAVRLSRRPSPAARAQEPEPR